MSDPSKDGIKLTKEYYNQFIPTDLQWSVTNVSDDFTLYDLFRLVNHIDFVLCLNVHQSSITAIFGMSRFYEFWEQINLPRDSNDIDNIAYLELYWCPDFDTRATPKIGKSTDQKSIKGLDDNGKNYWDNPYIAEMSSLMTFHGIGHGCPSKDYHKCNKNCPTETPYGIWCTPINNLAHLPIRVSPKVEFPPPFVESDRDFKHTGFDLTIQPTLWCLITSIFAEVTING